MDQVRFQTSKELLDWVIKSTHPEDLVLTSGGRMARQILQLFRENELHAKTGCWLPLRVMSLNDWLQRIWTDTWPEYMVASHWHRLLIWLKAIEKTPPPKPFLEGLSLADHLDQTYATLVRHRIDPAGREDTGHPLANWSSEVIRIFQKEMKGEGFIHPAEIPIYISGRSASESKKFLPKRILLAGLEQSSPLEGELFKWLDRMTDVIWMALSAGNNRPSEAVVLPDIVQEAEWIAEKAIEASQNIPFHRIGIALTDMKTYGGLFERILEDILGKRGGEGYASFNITMGKPLMQSGLAQAAILPLRLALEGQKRCHLFSLLQSPYYGIWSGKRHKLAMLDKIWRRVNLNSDVNLLIHSIKAEYPSEGVLLADLQTRITPLLFPESTHRAGDWNQHLLDIWRRLDFPICAGEEDQIAWEHLQEGIRQLNRDISNERMDLKNYFRWLSFFFDRTLFSVRGYENAGLQVMGLIEARGLSFDRLFIVGMVSGFLPQPARSFPFLSPMERRMIQGGTVEAQFCFSDVLFQKLMAAAPRVMLSRPEQKDGEPLIQSPFWPEEEEKESVDLWNTESPIWARCEWLSQTRKGIESRRDCHPPPPSAQICKEPIPIPDGVSVTSQENGIACPFKFFALHCLKIQPLDAPQPGLIPQIRGEMIHKCLSLFVEETIRKDLNLVQDWDDVKLLLQEVATHLLSPLLPQFLWQVELKRWLDEGSGEDEDRGLLNKWLKEEKGLWEKGMRWHATEVPFSNLRPKESGVRVSGRIDRVDRLPGGGYICWDYKTGQTPTKKDVEQLRATQMFPYTMAIMQGLTQISLSPDLPVSGGYIRLGSSGGMKHQTLSFSEEEWKGLLIIWEKAVAQLFKQLKKGDVTPSPHPEPTRNNDGACQYCQIQVICGYKLRTHEIFNGE